MKTTDKINNSINHRLYGCVKSAVPSAMKTARFLLSIMIPVSLAVTLLKYTGILEIIAGWLNPMFSLIGLPGSAALVFITSMALNIYSAIAVISTLPFSERELTILAIMCLISHNYFVETAIQKKTGSSAIKITMVRFVYSFIGAYSLNLLMPAGSGKIITASSGSTELSFTGILSSWFYNSLYLIVQILVIVTLLLILQKILDEFGFIDKLAIVFRPLLRIMGLPDSVAFLWIVANTLGLAYGSAIMIEQSESGKLIKEDADLLNHHIGISHSLLEDTLLFVAIGVPALWIILPRMILATIEVWLLKLRKFIFRRSNEPCTAG
ncbi:MAG TPA: nucleoside recognition domain-containing protein [Spirochaetota bacterium]|nr:nucleoside recognition domain-containing protein [Spirochaetota bacterium]